MKEPHIEGVATHDDPESCSDGREVGTEALTGARAGRAIEPRKDKSDRGADALTTGGRQHRWRRFREPSADLAGSENLCMRGISMRENREVPCLPVRVVCGRAAGGTLRR